MTNDIAELDRQIAAMEAQITGLEQSGDSQLSPLLLDLQHRQLAEMQTIRDRWSDPS